MTDMDTDSRPTPTIGRIVQYTLSEHDAAQIYDARHGNGHRGNEARAGDVYPMVITRVWGPGPGAAVNGQVFLDGNDLLWVTSATEGAGPRHFRWPSLR